MTGLHEQGARPGADRLERPLSAAEFARFAVVCRWLPASWTSSARRRRLLLLAMAAPGFAALVSTPLHQSLAVLAVGAGLFVGALGFRRLTEGAFVRAEAAALWPPSPTPKPELRRHA